MDFRDHTVRKALDESVRPFRPEATRRARLRRVAAISALAFATFAGFWTVMYFSSPKHKAPAAKPIAVELLPAQPGQRGVSRETRDGRAPQGR